MANFVLSKLSFYLKMFALIAIGFGLMGFHSDWKAGQLDQQFVAEGARAKIISISELTQTDMTQGEGEKKRRITSTIKGDVSFMTADGKRIDLPKYPLSKAFQEKMQGSDDIHIDYLTSEPTTIRLADLPARRSGWIVDLASLAIGLLLLFALRSVKAKN